MLHSATTAVVILLLMFQGLLDAPPYTLVESKIANFAHYRRVNGQETDAYSSSRKPRRTLYSLLVQTAIDPQAPCMT